MILSHILLYIKWMYTSENDILPFYGVDEDAKREGEVEE